LATLLWQLEQFNDVLELTGGVDASTWASPGLANLHGQASLAIGRPDRAVAAFHWALDAGVESQLGTLAIALRILGRHDEALEHALNALAVAPYDWEAGSVAFRELLRRNDRAAAWTLATNLLQVKRPVAIAPSALAHAATTQGQETTVADLVDHDAWLERSTLGIGTDQRDELVVEVFAHALPEHRRSRRATNGEVDRVEDVHLLLGPAVSQLLAHIRCAVDRYVSERAATHRGHPVVVQAPTSASIEAWALDVRRDGHEAWHVHPGGWLSGVVYLDVPDASRESGGTIDFGPLPLVGDDSLTAWTTRRLRPKSGDVLLFPSFFGHRTWPTFVEAPRRCIAFDIRESDVYGADRDPVVGT
jgi:hypothetical protein